ncbi:MAG: agmatine deiminase family protein [Peptostreptococcus sp.]|uniref:agmatine deiminase family protein n=1 Tax=Peptostreptococcus sp. TaxID=1262 RepID=UPI002FC7D160
MNKKIKVLFLLLAVLILFGGVMNKYYTNNYKAINEDSYYMPAEDDKHEGTWLQWPHKYTYGASYQKSIEDIWITMTRHLSKGENVHIIAYNNKEKNRIDGLLKKEKINMEKIDFFVEKNDDVWVRDNGPIFVYDRDNELKILDWGFNGWGKKEPYKKSNAVVKNLSEKLEIERIDLKDLVLEGGAVELDGNGTFLATKSSILNKNRNKKFTQKELEDYVGKIYGVENFIWLDGEPGIDITDFHIDGFAKFYNNSTIIALDKSDLKEWGVSEHDIEILLGAKNIDKEKYKYKYLPLTKENVKLKGGKDLGYKGSYINFYIANKVILVPNYNDSNDNIANNIIENLYPNKEVVGIDVRELYKEGGMIHCVTQQQAVNLKNKVEKF